MIARAMPTFALLLGAVYCLFPVAWVLVAATKSSAELFATTTLSLGSSFAANLVELHGYRGGVFWQWMANSALYAGVGALLSAAVSGVAGFALAKYSFRGRDLFFNALIAGVLVPSVVLAVPQYLLLAEVGLTDSYLSVLLPGVISPYGIYLARIHAAAVSVLPLIGLFLLLQRYWRIDLLSGSVKA